MSIPPFTTAPLLDRIPQRFKGVTLMLSAAILFSVLNLLIKLLSPDFRVWDIALYRFSGGLLLIMALSQHRRRLFQPHRPLLMVVRGITGTLAFVFLVAAIQRIPLATAMVFFYCFPAFAALFSALLFKDRMVLLDLGSILLALIGVAVLLDLRLSTGFAGQLMALTAGILAGLTVALIRELRVSNGAAVIYFYFCLVGACVTFWPFIRGPQLPSQGRDLVLIMGICIFSWGAQLLMNHGFKFCKSWEGGLLMTSEVVFTAILGVLLLNEILSWRLWVGGMLVIGSALACQRRHGARGVRDASTKNRL